MFYQKNYEEVLNDLESNENGLSQEKAKELLEKHGYNELQEKDKVPVWKLFLESFKDPLVIILLIAAIVQIALGETMESLIIFAVIILNSILGVVQTKKAESSLDSLKALSAPNAKVIRDGNKLTIPAKELVPGDIVILEAGDYVPADGRLIEAQTLKCVEGMLTGESEPVLKHTDVIADESPLGDQKNMVFSGSMVVYGRGTFVTTGTGMNSEMGKIAGLLENADSKLTPLQQNIEAFSKKLGVGITLLALLIFGIQVGKAFIMGTGNMGEVVLSSFMFAVAIAVAAIPEALSSIMTIVLAVGTNNMAKKQAIIRKLPAVETLGSAKVICTDKTGTLTQNKMTVVDLYMNGTEPEVMNSAESYESNAHSRLLTLCSVLCNDSAIGSEGQEIGDPTETALINFANKNGLNYEDIRNENPRVEELPFDSDRKLMTTVNKTRDGYFMFTKGAPDIIFSRSKYVLINGEKKELTDEIKQQFRIQNEGFSNRALRVLAFTYKEVDEGFAPSIEDEDDLTLIGLLAMIDPPRAEVIDAVAEAKEAGIKTVMITGDHKTTAAAIAREIGIMEDGDLALTGQELDALTEEELDEKLEKITVYARVSPENKIRIVRAWQKKDCVSAMTGDGVNDAPALKQADIGIGMGSGTDVAKDASDMVLVDDNFASIVNAVEVGRTVYSNIKKSITYLFAGNFGAIIAILFAVFANWTNPFTALQLLFINLVNDSLPAIALGFEPTERGTMKRAPRPAGEGILADGTMQRVVFRGIVIGIVTIIAQYIGMQVSPEFGVAMAFTTLIFARTLQTIASRSNVDPAVKIGFFSNKYVIGAMIVCFLLYSIVLIPAVRPIFSIPLAFGMQELGICIGLALISTLVMEVGKIFMRKSVK